MQENTGYLIGMVIGAVIVGGFCGLAPLIAGFIKRRGKLGIIGFACCVIGSSILGIILALPVALIFTLVIALRKSDANQIQNPPNPPAFSD